MIEPTEIFCLNERGKRSNNEDSIFPRKGTASKADRLFIVCDGVGGEKKGEVASETVSRAVHEYVTRQALLKGREKGVVQNAVHYANEKLAAYVQSDPDAKRMSTTLALVLLGENSVIAAWCGDTRIHHIRGSSILWKSRDHSLVGELISQGELTEAEARRHPQRNVITRSLNALNFNSAVDYHEIRNFEQGDYLLLCTDGLLEQVDDHLIGEILTNEKKKDKAKAFFEICEGVTKDNFSMYLIRGQYAPPRRRHLSASLVLCLIVLGLLLLYFAVSLFAKGRFF